MDRPYQERPSNSRRKSRTHHQSAALSATLSSSNDPVAPTRPEPTASTSPRDARERRRRERLNGPRSVPHQGTICDNNLCENPNISADERLCSGPEGLNLCSRCYKRFKIERRRAREEQRDINDSWRKPKRSPGPINVPGEERRGEDYVEKPPPYEPQVKESIKQPSTQLAPVAQSEKNESLHNFPTSSFQDYERRTSRSPRKHNSRQERDGRRHSRRFYAQHMPSYDDAESQKHRGWGEMMSTTAGDVAAAAGVGNDNFKYTPSYAQVNSTLAFDSGGGTRKSVNDTDDGIGAGTDAYTYYQGNASNFPSTDRWISFNDMWKKNYDTFKYSCGWLKRGDDNTPEMIQDIYNAIQDRANASLVDHRIILATIIQETNGCPLSPPTTSSGGTRNPGLMQSHNGHAYDPKHSRLSILLMVQDGTQGTEHGWGLVDNLNTYGNPYKAMRGYNSGYIPKSGDLSEEAGATACYVSDIANRLTGWVRADSTCPDDAN
ncbi:hypothetical protein GRF29_106g906808 [Pseudopithomyces chartarum]|uniref:Uncharacterized protein n=1 Tax=Pseudopithomyces chartarum TaxID=1892770 RepID=A0AAN6LU95_9PLEO|nr:hypothetical protein GRF29_106g906808 [Pseudopithomyces chartarum]